MLYPIVMLIEAQTAMATQYCAQTDYRDRMDRAITPEDREFWANQARYAQEQQAQRYADQEYMRKANAR